MNCTGVLHGAVIGADHAIFFPSLLDANGGISAASFTLPNAITSVTVTGLTPNATYVVQINALSYNIHRQEVVGGTVADAAGVIRM
jgi:hypothetical protein